MNISNAQYHFKLYIQNKAPTKFPSQDSRHSQTTRLHGMQQMIQSAAQLKKAHVHS